MKFLNRAAGPLHILPFAPSFALALLCAVFLPQARGEEPPPFGGCTDGACHADLVAAGSHDPVRSGQCALCHVPEPSYRLQEHSHSSFDSALAGREACLSCHPDMKGKLNGLHAHEAFRDEDCLVCHDPHGAAAYPDLLRNAYPPRMYARYRTEGYALCWECHDSALATEKFTDRNTGFRMGKRNFHYSHLQKRRGGMSCRSCHDPHESGQVLLIRATGPPSESGWKGRLVFTQTSRGGRCVGGCHKDISYRR